MVANSTHICNNVQVRGLFFTISEKQLLAMENALGIAESLYKDGLTKDEKLLVRKRRLSPGGRSWQPSEGHVGKFWGLFL